MKRRLLFNTSALSLLLCIATAIMFPVSYFRVPAFVRTTRLSRQLIELGHGHLVIVDQRGPGMTQIIDGMNEQPDSWQYGWNFSEVWGGRRWRPQLLPYGDWKSGNSATVTTHGLTIPLWWLSILFAFPAIPIMAKLRRCPGPNASPYCSRCSYDLTGNTSGVCPECGTAVAGKAGFNA